jgi:putative tryptophan/tyrosine transport system substrate-binding protein
MKRRDFITLLIGGVAAAWPVEASGQQRGKRPIVGFFGQSTPMGESERAAAFARRLHELGWIEGRTIVIEYRWAEGRSEHLAEIAAEFARLKVDVIVTGGTPAVMAAKQAMPAVPIVFAAVGDPVGMGLVTNLARPRERTLCLSRSAYAGQQPAAHQHLGAGCAPASDARLSGAHRSGRADVLRTELPGFVPARR